MKKLFTFFLALAAGVGTMFAAVVIDGIAYNLNDDVFTAEVTQGANYSSEVAIPSSVTYNAQNYSVTSIGDYAFFECTGLTSITIPNSVTSIGLDAFKSCTGLTSVTIGNSVTSIGDYAFSITSLTSITIPNSVTSIGDYAFYGCKSLTSATIGNSVTSIGARAFYGCKSLTSVTIPNSVTSIGEEAFCSCTGLTSITIPNSVTSIGNNAFKGCTGLTSPVYNVHVFAYLPKSYSGVYAIPDGIETIAGGAFYGCKSLTSVTIPNSVTSIESEVFFRCIGLTSIEIPNSVRSIGDDAFYECTGLTSITIPNSVTSIGYGAFKYCTGLTSVAIGNSVTSIGQNAFWGCTGLTTIICEAVTPPTCPTSSLGVGVFCYVDKSIPIYVPAESVGAYKSAKGWKEFTNILAIGEYFLITFVNWDSSTLQISHVKKGDIPTYTGEKPTRSSDEQYIYVFSGWTPTIVAATEDATYTATYEKVNRSDLGAITVRLDPQSCSDWETVRLWAWTDGGNLFDAWPGQVVTKDADGWYSYTFDESIKKVNIIWNDGTNQTVDIESVEVSTCYKLNETVGTKITVSTIDCPENIMPISAEKVDVEKVEVETSENEVSIAWPQVSGAYTYELVIKDKAGNIVCTLVFNAQGQLLSIKFNAPAQNGAPQHTQAAGFAFTVTGLETGTTYDYTIVAKDEAGAVLNTETGSFTTLGGEQAIDNANANANAVKLLRDGQILIQKGDKTFDLRGQEVK